MIDERFEKAIRNAPSSPNGTMVGASGFYSVDLTQNPEGEELLIQTMREAKELAAKYKERLELEKQRAHDERLRNTLGQLTYRSCANPGSVSQEELNDLAQPYEDSFYVEKTPSGVESCSSVYLYLAQGGRDAAALRRMSTPLEPINPNPPPQTVPAPVQAIPVPADPFRTVLPDLKDFAIAACRAPEQVALDNYLYRPYDHSASAYDGNAANLLATGLGDCPRQLFRQLIAAIRAGQGVTIDRQWIRIKVAAYTPETGTTPGYTPPQTGGGRKCEDFGVINCPNNLQHLK